MVVRHSGGFWGSVAVQGCDVWPGSCGWCRRLVGGGRGFVHRCWLGWSIAAGGCSSIVGAASEQVGEKTSSTEEEPVHHALRERFCCDLVKCSVRWFVHDGIGIRVGPPYTAPDLLYYRLMGYWPTGLAFNTSGKLLRFAWKKLAEKLTIH